MRTSKHSTTWLITASIALLGLPASELRADVSPGETVTAASRDKVKGLIPEELLPFAVQSYDDLKMNIVARESYAPHPKYVEATVKYACQAKLDEQGRLVNYTAGQPFPYSEWAKEATGHRCDLTPDDPQFATKLAWNVNYRWQGSGLNLPHWGFSNMRNRGKETWRIAQGEYRRTYFSHRADLLPETHQLEPGTPVEWAEFFDVKTPFDLRGTMFLLYRYTEQGREDDTWAYVPALRRVRRIATTQKSDSLLGTEFTLEDFYIFAGYVWDHNWEFRGEDTHLATMNSRRDCFPTVIGPEEATRTTGMTRLGTQEEWAHCSFGPYGALPFNGETWQKRTTFQLDDIPRQEGHPYSRKKIWYDKETMMPLYGITYDRAGQPFRVLTVVYKWSEDSEIPVNEGKNVLNGSYIMVANLQNENSHVGQFDNANAVSFSIEESKSYYDTTRLKTRGR